MKTTIKPISHSESESNQHSTEISVWILNESTITVWLGALIEDDDALYSSIQLNPNERKLLNIQSDAILAIELEKLPPENEALYLTNEESNPFIQIADDTDYIDYPIRIGIAADIFNRLCWEDYDIIIEQDNKYPDNDK